VICGFVLLEEHYAACDSISVCGANPLQMSADFSIFPNQETHHGYLALRFFALNSQDVRSNLYLLLAIAARHNGALLP
jgi:hypothetical protein